MASCCKAAIWACTLNCPCSWCNQVLWSPQMVQKYPQELGPPIRGGTSDWRWHLQSEVGPPIEGEISNWRTHLWLEVGPPIGVRSPIGGDTSDWRWDLQLEVRSPNGVPTSDQRWHLWLEVGPPIGGTHVTCRNQLFFEKKRDYLLLITSSHHLSTRWNVNLL